MPALRQLKPLSPQNKNRSLPARRDSHFRTVNKKARSLLRAFFIDLSYWSLSTIVVVMIVIVMIVAVLVAPAPIGALVLVIDFVVITIFPAVISRGIPLPVIAVFIAIPVVIVLVVAIIDALIFIVIIAVMVVIAVLRLQCQRRGQCAH
jgi:hypothetical protein